MSLSRSPLARLGLRRHSAFLLGSALAVASGCADVPVAPVQAPLADAGFSTPSSLDRSARMVATTMPTGAASIGTRDVELEFYHPTSGELAYWIVGTDATIHRFGSYGSVPTTWEPVAAADLTGDGTEDLVWQSVAGGAVIGWQMTAANTIGSYPALPAAPASWRLAALTDLNGDGRADYVWQGRTSGEVVVWLMNATGTAIASSASLGSAPAPWRIAAAGDIDGDGHGDIVWENSITGARLVWLMNGVTRMGSVDLGAVPTNWTLAAVNDLDGDGHNDIFWQDRTTGYLLTWLMQGTVYRATVSPGATPPTWVGVPVPWQLRAVRRTGSGSVASPISLGAAVDTVLLDQSTQLTLTGRDAGGQAVTNASATWTSSAPSIVTVDPQGVVHTHVTGLAVVTAQVGLLTAQATINVAPHFVQVATGATHACGLTGTGQVYCWGSNVLGGLGTSTPYCDDVASECSSLPVLAANGQHFASVAAGDMHTCALTSTGKAYCWGANFYGQLGSGSTVSSTMEPNLVAGGLTFTKLVLGRMHSCGIATDGQSYCWGWDASGQLGTGTVATDRCSYFGANDPCSRTPVRVTGSHGFVSLSAAENTSCGLNAAGEAYCWGLLGGGLSDGTTCQGANAGCMRTPVRRGTLLYTDYFDVGLAECGRVASGLLYCNGFEYSGVFGNGVVNMSTSTPVLGVSGQTYANYTFGGGHACAIQSSGGVVCWGANTLGQVGAGTTGTPQVSPIAVGGGLQFAQVTSTAQSAFTCGVARTGRAYCWGDGRFGQLGNGSFTSSPTPSLVRLVQ